MSGIPKQLLYQSKVEASAARSYRSNIQPQSGGNFGVGDTITFNIPTRNNLVMAPTESYFKFKVEHTTLGATNYLRLDSGGAHGYIQRLRIFHGSNLIEDIDNYNVLAKMMYDIQAPTDATYGKHSILSGTRSDLTVTNKAITAGAATPLSNFSVFQTNSGYRFQNKGLDISPNAGLVQLAAGQPVYQTFCINLISLIGSLCSDKYLPLFAMTSNPLRVEIQLVSNVLSAVCSAVALATTPLVINNCEFVAQFIELGDSSISTIMNATGGGPLQFVTSEFKNDSKSSNGTTSMADGASTMFSVPLSMKYSSLKSIFVAIRDSTLLSTATYFPHSSNNFNLLEYYFRIGPNVLPSKNPNNYPEMFAELLKSIASMSDYNHQPSIDIYSYNQTYPLPNTDETATSVGSVSSGSFYIGLDLENYSNADRSTIFAGFNSNTDDITFNPTFGKNDAARTLRFDCYALFDSVLVCENGTCYVKF